MRPLISRCALPVYLGLVLAICPAAAEEPELVTDRPDQTESSSVVAPGRVQVEAGWTFSNDEDGVDTETAEFPGTLVRIGLVDRLELRLGWTGYVREEIRIGASETDDDGAGDTEIGAKVYLREERGAAPEIALLVGASLPTGADDFSSERVDPSFRFSLSHTLTERLGLGYNLGASWESAEDDGGERDTLSSVNYTVALGIGLSERFGAFVELYGDVPASAPDGPANAFDGGFTWLLRNNLQLDVAGGLGLSDDADDWFAGAGVSVRLPR